MAASSGYGDHEKLAAARELAQTFKPAKATKGSRSAQYLPKKSTVSFGIGDSHQALGSRVPAPSQRQYMGLGKFGTSAQDTTKPPLLGKSGIDFLRRVDSTDKPAAAEKSGNPEPQASMAQAPLMADLGSSLVIQAKPKNIAKGSLVETFYAIVEDSVDTNHLATPNTEPESLIDFDDDDRHVSVDASKFAKTLTLLSPTPASAPVASIPTPNVDVSEAMHQNVVEAKPSAHVSDASPKAMDPSQPAQAKKSVLCPRASDFIPKQIESPAMKPEPFAEAEAKAQPVRTRSTSLETIPVRPEISTTPGYPAALGFPVQTFQTIVPVPLMVSVLPMTAMQMAPPAAASSAVRQPAESHSQPLQPNKVSGGLKTSRWAS
ncbi:hypothetical protein CP533_4588 [Ophiocordyceps camponoti-saundersi (nom. inval.)]|nr:hypothetical protein CP533_4588 [Ophiocordyceps camponoti-saundersi (nom. inval.)]